MKKILGFTVIAAIGLASTSVFATKARLLALGMNETDNEGSYYIDDNRNIFMNAANINNYADSVIIEWGSNGASSGGSGGANKTDQDHSPQAEGGFFKRSGNFVYGLYYGAESNTSSLLRVVASSPTVVGAGATGPVLDSADNQLDIFFGGTTAGLKWAGDFVYTTDKNQSRLQNDSAMAIKLGLIGSNWDSFANISLRSKSVAYDSGVSHKFDGKLGFHVGGGYKIGNGKVFGYIKTFKWDQYDSSATAINANRKTTVEGKFTNWSVGYAHTTEVSSKSRVFTSIAYYTKSIEADFGAASGSATDGKTEAKNTLVPVVIGYEADATSWLTLRGSITQNLHGKRNNKNYGNMNALAQAFAGVQFGSDTKGGDVSIDSSTSVNAGATLNFGKLKLDGMIGTTNGARNGATFGTSTASGQNGRAGVLALDNLMTRVGMTYNF
ncbi:hypothetical protein A9Q84_07300 [Halobacteriovorax marinus]|uniref:Uncharacterized protein n=1 Tax=Halobacteriovorax marinus TaxID=97084 RepID=A0A1Y5FB04_9BACT|nr:hypothetical protein A9Q84_07300 [Halobacteriovorax marinus]